MKDRDTYIVNLSDTHSGGSTALFPDYRMDFDHNGKFATNHDPTREQKAMFQHWLKCAEIVKAESKGKRIIIVHNGDALEGFHHGSIQTISPIASHQIQIHLEVFEAFLKKSGFSPKNGDELHYTSGTESHTNWDEFGIAEHLNAQFHDELQMSVNGKNLWWTHHGANSGKGANEGDSYRTWLKSIYWDCLREYRTKPDAVISAHYHKSIYQTYVQDWHTIHGILLPSWQMKTRYAYRAAPFQRNDIGMSCLTVSAEGIINVRKSVLL